MEDFHFSIFVSVTALHFAQWPSNLHNHSIERARDTAIMKINSISVLSTQNLCKLNESRELFGMFERKMMPKQKDQMHTHRHRETPNDL